MPLIHSSLLMTLLAHQKNDDAIYFKDYPFPLLLNFSPRVRDVLREMNASQNRNRSVRGFIHQLNAYARCPTREEKNSLINTNTPEEWQLFKEMNDHDES